MKTIRSETIIDASPKAVWDVLMDFRNYPAWNPFVVQIGGPQQVGQTLDVSIQLPGRKRLAFRPTVTRVERGRSFRWRGRFISGLLFEGEHGFAVEPAGGGARFIHDEVFSGALVAVLGRMLSDTHRAFGKMDEALKRRVEEAQRSHATEVASG